jgi:hypothetical protein
VEEKNKKKRKKKGQSKLKLNSNNCLKTRVCHFAVCLTTGPQPLPKRVLHTLRSNAYSFNFQQLLFSLRSSSRCLRFLPCLPVIYFLLSIFPSITCSGRQFLLNMRPIQLAFLFMFVYIYIPVNSPILIYSAHNFKNGCCKFVWLEQTVTVLDKSVKNLQAASNF